MINNIKQAIVDKLAELYPTHTIWTDDVAQDFITPSFLILLTDQDYNKRINTKYKSLLSFDVAYFSNKDVTEIKTNCQAMQLILFRSFDLVGTYRILNKQASITDNVLHFKFDVNYSEIIQTAETKMRDQTTNTTI